MAEDAIDWGTAPEQFRAAHKAQADELATLRASQEKSAARIAEIDRRDRFAELKAAGGEALADVTLEDVGTMPADQITPTILQAKALEKSGARAAALAQLAKTAGFESAEALQTFMAEREAAKAATTAAQAQAAVVATSGSAGPDVPKAPGQAAYDAFADARTTGLPPDDARVAGVNALIQASLAQQAAGQ